ncbi:hypothetical protein BC826DRAFT_966802 [Russula brevipes]|nr:hypothetical protein BC826DRAFT_966802 [Russula brevipes]
MLANQTVPYPSHGSLANQSMVEPVILPNAWPFSLGDEGCEGARNVLCDTAENAYLTIDVLPDDVLLDIFDFCKLASSCPSCGWFKLVHVSRRWRSLVFASRHRLDLRLFCTYGTPVRKILDCWPPLPIIVQYDDPTGLRPHSTGEDDNIIAALQHSDRVRAIGLTVGSTLFAKLSPLMQRPLPLLECLTLRPRNNERLVLPGTFLGGSTPRLRNLHLDAVASPALPAFLPSCRNLVTANPAHTIRHPNPSFPAPPPAPGTSSSPATAGGQQQRVALPALSYFEFRGTSEFLEDFVAKINSAPSLARTCISFFDHERQHHHPFEIPRLAQFIGRTDAQQQQQQHRASEPEPGPGPGLTQLAAAQGRARVGAGDGETGDGAGENGDDDRVAPAARLVRAAGPAGIPDVPDLPPDHPAAVARAPTGHPHVRRAARAAGHRDAAEWLGLLYTFGGVERLYVTYGSVPDVARALQRVSGSGEWPPAEVLPALRELHFDWFAAKWERAVASFITARELSGHPPIAFHQPKKVLA